MVNRRPTRRDAWRAMVEAGVTNHTRLLHYLTAAQRNSLHHTTTGGTYITLSFLLLAISLLNAFHCMFAPSLSSSPRMLFYYLSCKGCWHHLSLSAEDGRKAFSSSSTHRNGIAISRHSRAAITAYAHAGTDNAVLYPEQPWARMAWANAGMRRCCQRRHAAASQINNGM